MLFAPGLSTLHAHPHAKLLASLGCGLVEVGRKIIQSDVAAQQCAWEGVDEVVTYWSVGHSN